MVRARPQGARTDLIETRSAQPCLQFAVGNGAEHRLYRSFLILLRHKFSRRERLPIGAAQHGHRESVPASATTNRLRIVAMEFGT